MNKITSVAIASAIAGSSMAAVLWDQSQLITHPGQGFGGADASAVDSAAGSNLFGWGAQGGSIQNTMADSFMVSSPGWIVNRITVFSYQTGSTTTSTITGLFLKIWDTNPLGQTTAFPGVWGDFTTNVMTSTSFTNIYRVTETTLTNTQRPIMRVVADGLNIVLNPGEHWLGFNLTGTLASGPWTPPVSPQTPAFGVNAMQAIGASGVFNTTASPSHGDTTFIIEGTVIPEPGTLAVIGLGLAALAARRRRK